MFLATTDDQRRHLPEGRSGRVGDRYLVDELQSPGRKVENAVLDHIVEHARAAAFGNW